MKTKYTNFREDSDPIHDMDIGMDAAIKHWVENETKYRYDEYQLLWICAEGGKIEFVKYILNKGYNVHIGQDAALLFASGNGHAEIVKLLLDAGANVNADDDTALRWATYYGHTKVVKLLLDAGANVHTDTDYPLKTAQYYGHTEIVKLLQDHIDKENKIVKESVVHFKQDSDPIDDMNIGADKVIKYWIENETDYSYIKEDLLWICAEKGKTEFVKYLVDKGADVHLEYDLALRRASINGHVETVKVLIDAGANVHALNNEALRNSGYNGHVEVVKVLLDAGADMDTVSIVNCYNHIEVVKLLLNAGINIHLGDDYALRWASTIGYTEIVKLLLAAGADVHARNDESLHSASFSGRTEIVKLLLDAGADVHTRNGEALQDAVKNGHIETVKVLLAAGADVHAKNDYVLNWAKGCNHHEMIKVLQDHIVKEKKIVKESISHFKEDSDPVHDMGIGMDAVIKDWVENKPEYNIHTYKEDLLWICAKYGKNEFVKYLLDKGYDIHYLDDIVLQSAIKNGHSEIVKLLLDKGANIHASNNNALRWASYYGHIEVVKLLLDAGADVHANGDQALRWASRRKHFDVVKLLQDHIDKENNIVKESISHFREDSDPIDDIGIGFMNKIKREMEEVIKFYKTDGDLKEWTVDNEFGYSIEIELHNYGVVMFYVIFREADKKWVAGSIDKFGPFDELEVFDTFDKALDHFEECIEHEVYYTRHIGIMAKRPD